MKPCEIDAPLVTALQELGPVRHIVAPGDYHHLHVLSAQGAFPDAATWICPGIGKRRPGLRFDHVLGDEAPEAWRGVLDQVHVGGARFIQVTVFHHRPSGTPIVVDLIEFIGDATPRVDRMLKLWWKLVFRRRNTA